MTQISPNMFRVISPVDGSEYAVRQYADAETLDRTIADAKKALIEWRRTPLAERVAIVLRFGEEMKARAPALAEAIAHQIGRPLWQCDETPRLVQIGEVLSGLAEDVFLPVAYPSDDQVTRYTRATTGGIHFSICAWNYPTAMIGYLVTAPLIAGNVVILKHSPQTPVTAEIADEAFRAAGGPPGVLQVVHMDHASAERLIGSGVFKKVNFIGSVSGGRKVHAATAGTFTEVDLELGGKDPAYVRSDADFDHAIPLLVEGCFSNSGQSCCSVERIYVDRAIRDRFVDAFVAEAEKWTIGHPLDGRPMVGSVVGSHAANFIRGHCDEAERSGAKRIAPYDAAAAALGDAYVAPQILLDVDHSMPVMREELFGPVACIESVWGDDEALALMNDTAFGLTASVWTQDIERGAELLDEVDVGAAFINRCDHADAYLPWGGIKISGMGRMNGRAGLLSATETKSYHVRRVRN